jgi:nucleoid-associated protein EbfC
VNILKMMGALKDMGKIHEEMQAVQKKLAAERFVGKAGGDMVTVTVSGAQEIIDCQIDPKLIEDNDRELIQSLVVAAANEAINLSRQHTAKTFEGIVGERFNMPGMEGMLKGLLGKT